MSQNAWHRSFPLRKSTSRSCLEPALTAIEGNCGDERKLRDGFMNDRRQRKDVHVTGDNRREKCHDYSREKRFPPLLPLFRLISRERSSTAEFIRDRLK